MFALDSDYCSYVTKQGVTEQGVCGCVCCVNARFGNQGFRVNPAVYFINENGEFYLFGRMLVLVVHGMHGEVVIWLCGMGNTRGRRRG